MESGRIMATSSELVIAYLTFHCRAVFCCCFGHGVAFKIEVNSQAVTPAKERASGSSETITIAPTGNSITVSAKVLFRRVKTQSCGNSNNRDLFSACISTVVPIDPKAA